MIRFERKEMIAKEEREGIDPGQTESIPYPLSLNVCT